MCQPSCVSILLYHTENKDGEIDFYDCIFHQNEATMKYCIRPNEALPFLNRTYDQCFNGGIRMNYKNFKLLNLTIDEILNSVSAIEMIDQYLHDDIDDSSDKFLCICNNSTIFGKYCEYTLFYQATTFSEAIQNQFNLKYMLPYFGTQLYGNISCYTTLIECDSDEEHCDTLEFNECDDDEYRCDNGACIAEEYFLDGEPDCQDQTDERTWIETTNCTYEPSFYCDESICPPHQFSCGDGQCILSAARIPLRHQFGLKQHCHSLRDHAHVCELSQNRYPTPLWTQKNTGSCLPWVDTNESYDQNDLPDYCRFLVKCALTKGLHNDCPCGQWNQSECHIIIYDRCQNQTMIIYPVHHWIAPFIFSAYNVSRNDWTISEPDKFLVYGSIKCRGYRGERYLHDYASVPLNLLQIGTIVYQHLFCDVYPISRDYTDQASKYDEDCGRSTKQTFNNRSYLFDDVCHQSNCISRYRVQDSLQNCQNGLDERTVSAIPLPSQQQKFRFKCSLKENKSLLVRAIGDENPDCLTNYYDEYTVDQQLPTKLVKCDTADKSGCRFLKSYITERNNDDTDKLRDISLPHQQSITLPFQYYCDTFWDTSTKEDESEEMCQEWICARNEYQCSKSKQCIPIEWLCNGEWDCSDASDEQGIFIISELSAHNQNLDIDFLKVLGKCLNIYLKQPYSNICNVLEEYPCLPASISPSMPLLDQIMNITSHPCIRLSQIGDGVPDCYGAIDERNVLSDCASPTSQMGFNFRCTTANPIMNCQVEYPFLCDPNMRCLNTQDDDVLCSYRANRTNPECNPDNPLDVVCYDGICQPNARCNGQIQCSFGEDEYWCNLAENIGDGNFFYRRDKRTSRTKRHYLVSLPDYPSIRNDRHKDMRTMSLAQTVNEDVKEYEIYHAYSLVPSICNRGIAVYSIDQIICFCPPSFYGRFCQYYSDRITVITHVEWPTHSFTSLNILVTLLFQNQSVIDYHIFRTLSNSRQKQRFYLVYKRLKTLLSHKQKRYLNRTQIMQEHPYSIRFEAYDDTMILIAVWYYKIHFDFLPAYRFSKVLKINRTNSTAFCSTNHQCNRQHSTCYRYQNLLHNLDSYYCHCEKHFMGIFCNETDADHYCLQCSKNSICKANYPLCFCSPNTYGPGCHLEISSICADNNPCQNNGTCYHSFDLSSPERYRCECTEKFHGKYCEIEMMKINLHFQNMPIIGRAATIQYYNFNRITVQLNLEYQYLYDEVLSSLSQIELDYSSVIPPNVALLKIYRDEQTVIEPIYYILYIQMDTAVVNIEVNFTDNNRCFDFRKVPKSKYHQLCRTNTSILCFYDDSYLCLCESDHYRAHCFEYNHFSDRCSSCLSNGLCLWGKNQRPQFKCVCPKCFYGDRCQYSTQLLAYTIDALVVKNTFILQLIYVSSIFLLFFLLGTCTNYVTLNTLARLKLTRQSVHIYIFNLSIVNSCSLLLLSLKMLHILLSNRGILSNNYSVNRFCCKAISYSYSIVSRTNNWLTSFISIEGLIMVYAPHSFSNQSRRRFYFRLMFCLVSLLAIMLMHLHEAIYYTLVEDAQRRFICTIDYSNLRMTYYSQINAIVHYFLPFTIHVSSITLLIVLAARQRARTQADITLLQILKNQFRRQKQLYIPSLIIILTSIPHLIFSFTYQCKEFTHDWQRHMFLLAYLLSHLHQVLGFILHVLPSDLYRQEFQRTKFGKWLINQNFLST